MMKNENVLSENSGNKFFDKDFCDQITDTVKTQNQSKEVLFNVFQQQLTSKPFLKGPPESKFHHWKQNISFKQRSNDSS